MFLNISFVPTFKQFMLFLGAVLFANSVGAQVYKCTFIDKNTHQTNVVYTDASCGNADKQSLTIIQTHTLNQSKVSANNLPQDKLTATETEAQLDNAVNQAVLGKNFAYAKSIAKTKEQWRLIALSEKVAEPANVPNTSEPTASNNDCKNARDDFESASRLSWRDDDLKAAKKSSMFAACGVAEPQPAQTILVNRSYHNHHNYLQNNGGYNHGGIQSGHWVAPDANYPHNPNQTIHMAHDAQAEQVSTSFHLNITGKHFGVQASSFEQQNLR